MADPKKKLAGNAAGEFYVDSSCIDCDLCRQIAPLVFREEDGASIVRRQPVAPEEVRRAEMALVTCPTASIGTEMKRDLKAAIDAYPERIAEGIYFCGFASESSFGASSYLIRRPGGNLLVDSPRAARPLLKRLEELGGVAQMFLTHRDDVADHQLFHRRFGCERILHAADVTRGTRDVERQLAGREPVAIGDDLLAIPVPGHTPGSAALLYRERFLFTGDHLWWSDELGRLHASRSVCWYSWPEQRRSLERLLDFRFEWVLPGHGRRYQAPSAAVMRVELERAIAALR